MGSPTKSGDRTPVRVGYVFGVGATVLVFVGIGASVALSPWFSWTEHALSDLGEQGRSMAPVFNATVGLSGVLGLGFARYLWTRATGRLTRAGAGLFTVATAAAILIGLFPTPHPVHGPVSGTFFLAGTYALACHGTGEVLGEERSAGLFSIWLAIVNATVWIGWFVLNWFDGVAVPEVVGLLAISLWVGSILWRDRHRVWA